LELLSLQTTVVEVEVVLVQKRTTTVMLRMVLLVEPVAVVEVLTTKFEKVDPPLTVLLQDTTELQTLEVEVEQAQPVMLVATWVWVMTDIAKELTVETVVRV
jgi:hypothetical protein